MKLRSWRRRWLERLDDFVFGAALSWVSPPYQIAKRREYERIFALLTSCELHGTPLLPAHWSLRLLPHLVPYILYWRRMTSFDRDLEGADLKHLGH